MPRLLTTFPNVREFSKAQGVLDARGLRFSVIRPEPAYARVGVPCVVVDDQARMTLAERGLDDSFVCSGWVEHRATAGTVPSEAPTDYAGDIFGIATVMVLAPCVADLTRIRITAHISGDLQGVFPYLNATMRSGCFTPTGPTFTFMDQHRMVCLYPRRIAVAKADDVVDGWRVLENIRRSANEVWARRDTIAPSHERRERPPVVEICKRLPGTNCRECGELTCMAFAAKLWQGHTTASRCRPVFAGTAMHLRDALVEVCLGLGLEA